MKGERLKAMPDAGKNVHSAFEYQYISIAEQNIEIFML